MVAAGDGRGYLLTQEFILPAGELQLNADAAQGAIRVEVVCRQTTRPYPGLEREQCLPLADDAVAAPVRWRCADLRALVGKPVMLRFILEPGAQLYALTLG